MFLKKCHELSNAKLKCTCQNGKEGLNGYTGRLVCKCALAIYDVYLQTNKEMVVKQNLNMNCYDHTGHYVNRSLSTSGHSENYSQDDFFLIFNSFWISLPFTLSGRGYWQLGSSLQVFIS